MTSFKRKKEFNDKYLIYNKDRNCYILCLFYCWQFIVTKIDNDDCVEMFGPFSFLVSSLALSPVPNPPGFPNSDTFPANIVANVQ